MKRSARRYGLALGVGALAFAGCGGGERQDANEPSGSFTLSVVEAKFPREQRLADRSELVLQVRNEGEETVPNVAVTVDSFTRRSEQRGLADPERPVFIVDSGPRGGTTAYVSTWALGQLSPGELKTFRWRVTAVRPGTHTVNYTVAAGLDGKAKAQGAAGEAVQGAFVVDVAGEPAQARVDPETGKVIRDSE